MKTYFAEDMKGRVRRDSIYGDFDIDISPLSLMIHQFSTAHM